MRPVDLITPEIRTMSQYLEIVRSRPVIYDGSMGAYLLNMQLTVEDYGGKEGCNDFLVLSKPSVIETVHAAYLEAGAEVLETDTFGGSLIKLEEYGIGDRTYELNRAAAELAKRVAKEYTTKGKPRFVAGSVGPTGLLPALPRRTAPAIAASRSPAAAR